MRWLRAMLIPAAMFLLVSCSSSSNSSSTATATSTTSGSGAAGSSSGSSGNATATATSDSGGSSGSSSSGGSSSGSSGAATDDISKLIDDLTPPNSSEVARFTAPDGTNVIYSSTDSYDGLKSYYEGKLSDLGLQIAGTINVEGGTSWIIGNDSNGIGGTITVAPDSTDSNTSSVTVLIGSGG